MSFYGIESSCDAFVFEGGSDLVDSIPACNYILFI